MGKTYGKNSRLLATAISSIVLSGMYPLVSSAETQNIGLEEIVVTAQRRAQSSQDTPLSITPLGSEDILKRDIRNSADLIGEVPGIGGVLSPGARGTSQLTMRGVSGGSAANLSLDPAVALYLDGVYVGKMVGSSMDVAEIERIEVLRGPQGTLYGRNSTAGAVNVITRKPAGEFGARITGTAGNEGLWGIKTNIDTPTLGEVGKALGSLSASVGYQIRNRDGFYENTTPGEPDYDDHDREAWRIAINWKPTDSFSADYIYDHSQLEENGEIQKLVGLTPAGTATTDRLDFLRNQISLGAQFAQLLNPGDSRIPNRLIPSLNETISAYEQAVARGEKRPDEAPGDRTPYSDNDVDGHSLTLQWEAGNFGILGDIRFKSISAYREVDTYVFGALEDIETTLDDSGVGAMNDLALSTLVGLYTNPTAVLGPTNPLSQQQAIDNVWSAIDSIGSYHSQQDTTSEYEQFSQEIEIAGKTQRTDYVLGLYYFNDESNYDRQAIFAAPLSGKPRQRYSLETESFAIFGQITWVPAVLNDRLSLTPGLRYTEESKEIVYNYSTTFSPLDPRFTGGPRVENPAEPLGTKNSEDFYNLSGTMTIAFDVTPNLNSFLRYATGYRSGGFNGEIFNNGFDEETIEQWEIGIKSDWWDRRLRVNGSLYTYTMEDMQVSQISVDPATGQTTSSITNAAEAERWGGELELMLAPSPDLVLGLTYSYIHGDFEEFPELCNINGCIETTNQAKRGISPSNQVGLTADYTFARTSIGDITGFLQMNWQDSWSEVSLWTGSFNGNPHIYPHQGIDERTVVNARLSLENFSVGSGALKITLWGKNLTDDDYSTYAINFGALGPIAEQYGNPRTYGLDITYNY